MKPQALVTGTGRCGTGYTATVLRASGVNAGHEQWWSLHQQPEPGLAVDVSWLGMFDSTWRGPTYLQVRDPRVCVPSLAASLKQPWWLLYSTAVDLVGDPAVDACLIWLAFNRRGLDRCVSWWRVEDVTPDDLAWSGADCSKALAATPKDVNTRKRGEFSWPGISLDVFDLARQFGYDT